MVAAVLLGNFFQNTQMSFYLSTINEIIPVSIDVASTTCESGFKFKENANESIKIDYQLSDEGVYSNFKKIRIIFPNSETIFDCLEQSEETSVEVTIKYKHKVRIF